MSQSKHRKCLKRRREKFLKLVVVNMKTNSAEKKCFNIHIGKGHKECPLLSVHEKVMKVSESEKYLGDVVDLTGSISATIQSIKAKAQGIITGIMAILNDIPLGRHKMDIKINLK